MAELQFWRKSMVSSSIVMGALVLVALATLVFGWRHGLAERDWGIWVMVAALFSVIGLTKVIMANVLFYVLLQEEAPVKSAPAPPYPGLRSRHRRKYRHTTARYRPWARGRRRGDGRSKKRRQAQPFAFGQVIDSRERP